MADSKLTALSTLPYNLEMEDLLYVVDDPTGTPSSWHLYLSTLKTAIVSSLQTSSGWISGISSFAVNGIGSISTMRVSTFTKAGSVSPLDPSHGAKGDGASDDSAALQSAIDAAGALTSEFGPTVIVDLQGRTYATTSTLQFFNRSKVKMQNGKILAIGTWSDTRMIELSSSTDRYLCENVELNNIVIDCNDKTNGVYLDNSFRAVLEGLEILRFSQVSGYGIQAVSTNDSLRINRCNVHRGILPAWGLASEPPGETSIGFDIQSADVMITDCISHSCGILFNGSVFSNAQFVGNHFYGSNLPTATISTCIDDGGGLVKVVTHAANSVSTGNYAYITGVNGTVEANGFWRATRVDTTSFTLDGSAFSSAYTSGGSSYISRPTMILTSSCSGLLCTGNYFDASVVGLIGSFDHILNANHFTAGQTGLGSILVLAATSTTEVGNGLVVTNNRMKNHPVLAINGSTGSWNEDGLQMNYAHNKINSQEGGGDAYLTGISNVNKKFICGNISVTQGNLLIPATTSTEQIGSNTLNWLSVYSEAFRFGSNILITRNAGSPEGSVIGGVGSLCINTSGTAGTLLYQKQSGGGSTGWVAIA